MTQEATMLFRESRAGYGSERARKCLLLAGALVAVATLAAACGGGPHTAAAAQKSTTTATTDGRPAAQANVPKPGQAQSRQAQLIAYATCMRSHGVPNYPDPSSSGGGAVPYGGSTGINPNSPTFQAAQQVCQKYLPAGNNTSNQGKEETGLLKFAECMRSHGVSNFPDPSAKGLLIPQSINVQSSTFQAASNACKSLMPTPGG
jgi:hypothetical protein